MVYKYLYGEEISNVRGLFNWGNKDIRSNGLKLDQFRPKTVEDTFHHVLQQQCMISLLFKMIFFLNSCMLIKLYRCLSLLTLMNSHNILTYRYCGLLIKVWLCLPYSSFSVTPTLYHHPCYGLQWDCSQSKALFHVRKGEE